MTTFTDDSPVQALLDRLRNSEAQSLVERVDELRSRLIKCIIVIGMVFVGCFVAGRYIFAYMKAPLLAALPEGQRQLHFTGPLEVFTAYMKVSFLIAVLVTAPMLFYHGFQWVKPALPEIHRKSVLPYFTASIFLFIGGILFCYFLMMPTALQFLIGMGGDLVTPVITVDEYTSLMVFMLLGFGLVFQLPVALIIGEALGVIRLEHLTKHRRLVFIIILVVAAIVTPTPDPFSQLAMAVPMYLMFEAAIIIIRAKRRRSDLPAITTPRS